ncbi:hypothetical protein R0K18_34325, partial [Pantoea sp. SIMBA_133]
NEDGQISTLTHSDKTYTSYKTMTTTIITLSNRNWRLKTHVYWDRIPKTRSYDVIGTGINHNEFVGNRGTEYGKQFWTLAW